MLRTPPPSGPRKGVVRLVCPVCMTEQGVSLVAVCSRGCHVCTSCHRRLTVADVEKALHSPRH